MLFRSSASEKKDEKSGKTKYLVTVVNTDNKSSKNVEVSFANLKGSIQKAEATVVTGDKMNSCNTFEKSDSVVEKTLAAKIVDGQTVAIDMPSHSVASVVVYA